MLRSYKLYIFLLLSFCFNVSGQGDNKYNLLTERYVDRPLAMHKGQFQIASGYQFSIINQKYDQDGNKIDLTIDGSVSAQHKLPFTVKYGLFEFLQFSISTSYASMGIRSQSRDVISDDSELFINELNKYIGFYDLYAGTDLTIPIKLHLINWVITAGVSLPVFNYEPDKPGHSFTPFDTQTGLALLNYKYNHKNATGIPDALFGSAVKIRTKKFSFTGLVEYSAALKDGESYDWNFRWITNEFEYEKETYQFNTGKLLNIAGEAAWQAIDWFVLKGSITHFHQGNGWSNITGRKVGNPEISLTNFTVGYEILISPLLRIEQQIILPVNGKNILGQWAFLSGFSMNMMTFQPKP